MLGSPDLTDDYWMYGDSTAQLTESISQGRHGVMPPWPAILGETRPRLLAAYVWSLSHPACQTATPPPQVSASPFPTSPPPFSTPPRLPFPSPSAPSLFPSFFSHYSTS